MVRLRRPMSILYSIVKEPMRGERLIGEEPRAQITVRFGDCLVSRRRQTGRSVLLPVYRMGKSALVVCVLFSWRYSLSLGLAAEYVRRGMIALEAR